MGLDTTHNCWHGAYSAFMQWRKKIAQLAGFPPLELMQGFYENSHLQECLKLTRLFKPTFLDLDSQLPIKWDAYREHYSSLLLDHSDCEGYIAWKDCKNIANSLEDLLPDMKNLPDQNGHIGNWEIKTKTFIDGLRLAFSKKENVRFH